MPDVKSPQQRDRDVVTHLSATSAGHV
jgi:hypothetical protein